MGTGTANGCHNEGHLFKGINDGHEFYDLYIPGSIYIHHCFQTAWHDYPAMKT